MWEKKPLLFQSRDAGNGTPLHFATYTNYLDGVKFLIEKFSTSALEQDSKDDYLPIHVACMMNHVRIVGELLRQWPDPAEFPSRLGQNILHVSTRYGNVATVKYKLKSPKYHLINARDFNRNTPLHLAALHCQPSVVLLARDRRVDLNLVNKNNMTALEVAEHDNKVMNAPLQKWLTWTILKSTGTPRNGELAICKPIGWSPRKRIGLPEPDKFKDRAGTHIVVAALITSVTFTSGFSVPGRYNGSNPDAGIPILLHKAMDNVFVNSNSVAMYSLIMVLVILLGTHVNDPYVMVVAYFLSNLPMLVTLVTMPLAFMAGAYVTVTITELAGLSIFVLVFGSFALFIILSISIVLNFLQLECRHPLIRGFRDGLIFVGLMIARRETAGSGTAGRAAPSIRATCDDKLRRRLNR